MTGEPRASARTSSAAILSAVLCLSLGLSVPALGGPVANLKNRLLGRHPLNGLEASAPPVARYVTEDGDVFTLDRTQPKPLLKFENSFEVWALQPQPAPRGDIIYKNDLGEPVLRATRLGGVTIFTDQRPGGAAAALMGPGAPLRLAIMGPQTLFDRLTQAAFRTAHAVHRGISFDAQATPTSSALIADAALVTSEALVRMTKRSDSRKFVDQVRRVQLVEGRMAAVDLAPGGVLLITVAPPQGQAGRPSSDRILQVAQGFH